MSIYEAFLYEWTNIKNGKKYIGYHKGTITDGYICSSKVFLEEYNKNPDHFTRKILYYGTMEEMLKKEADLLSEVDAKNNQLYYNQHNGNGLFVMKQHTETTKAKMSESKIGKKLSDIHKESIRNGLLGFKKTQSHIDNHRQMLLGKTHSSKHKEKISEGLKKAWALRRNRENAK